MMNLSLPASDDRILHRHRATAHQDAAIRPLLTLILRCRPLPLLRAPRRAADKGALRMTPADSPVYEVSSLAAAPPAGALARAREALARWAVRIVLASRPETPPPS